MLTTNQQQKGGVLVHFFLYADDIGSTKQMTVDDFLSGNFMQGSDDDDDAEDLEVRCFGLDL